MLVSFCLQGDVLIVTKKSLGGVGKIVGKALKPPENPKIQWYLIKSILGGIEYKYNQF